MPIFDYYVVEDIWEAKVRNLAWSEVLPPER